MGKIAIAVALRKNVLVNRPTKIETIATVGRATQENKTHGPLMKTCHRSVMPDESPVINLPKSVCRSTNSVPVAARIALRIKPVAETNTVRSICPPVVLELYDYASSKPTNVAECVGYCRKQNSSPIEGHLITAFAEM